MKAKHALSAGLSLFLALGCILPAYALDSSEAVPEKTGEQTSESASNPEISVNELPTDVSDTEDQFDQSNADEDQITGQAENDPYDTDSTELVSDNPQNSSQDSVLEEKASSSDAAADEQNDESAVSKTESEAAADSDEAAKQQEADDSVSDPSGQESDADSLTSDSVSDDSAEKSGPSDESSDENQSDESQTGENQSDEDQTDENQSEESEEEALKKLSSQQVGSSNGNVSFDNGVPKIITSYKNKNLRWNMNGYGTFYHDCVHLDDKTGFNAPFWIKDCDNGDYSSIKFVTSDYYVDSEGDNYSTNKVLHNGKKNLSQNTAIKLRVPDRLNGFFFSYSYLSFQPGFIPGF